MKTIGKYGHGDFKDHVFKPADIVDQGSEVRKIFACACGARRIEIYSYDREEYEQC